MFTGIVEEVGVVRRRVGGDLTVMATTVLEGVKPGDSIAIDGAVANKVGTLQLAILAQTYGKPFHVATEVMKLQRNTMAGHPIELENRPGVEILDVEADFAHPEHIRIRHQFFDLTPARYIRSLITEQGVLAPAAIGVAWNAIDRQFDEGVRT